MFFPLGRSILIMLIVSALTGVVVLSRPQPTSADLRIWVFAESHAKVFRDAPPGERSLIDQYQSESGRSVRVDLISARALDARLQSLFNSGSHDVPDVVEIEINSVGKFLRPRLEQVGLLPLNTLIERDHLNGQILPSRFAPWTKEGIIFGIPADVHPVAITYRKDLFDAAGIDLSSATTWANFQTLCLRLQTYQNGHGNSDSWAFELPTAKPDVLLMMLLQRGINVIDDRNVVHLQDPRVLSTLIDYAHMAAGPTRISTTTTPGGSLWTRDLAAGTICAALTADWRVTDLRAYAPDLAGKLGIMPLPRFDPTDAPTSTWGGTMLGIPRNVRNPENAWQLLKFLATSDESVVARQRFSDIVSPVVSHWADPVYHQADSFFPSRPATDLFIELAPHVPPRQVTADSLLAAEVMGAVLNRSIRQYEDHGDVGLEQFCRALLDEASAEIRSRIAFGDFGT